jgi:hypothetical protein
VGAGSWEHLRYVDMKPDYLTPSISCTDRSRMTFVPVRVRYGSARARRMTQRRMTPRRMTPWRENLPGS